jgi:large repetitive protein
MKRHYVSPFLTSLFIFFSLQLQAQFTASTLNGYSLTNGTALQFGPDGRLYVTQQNGLIKVYTINRNGANNYQALKTELISLINLMPNYNDDGSVSSTKDRQVTGIWVEGTAAKPVIYIGSSDPRIGGPSGDKNLDTNSGIITRLTWKAASTPANTDFATLKDGDLWDKVDLVRGLPRSEENHASNGMQMHTVGGKKYLFVTSGGNTNAGSPSRNFTKITEYALSCAVLAIDLTAIEVMPVLGSGLTKYIYDIPTVDDPRRNNANGINNPATAGYNGIDINDPFGGDDGLNQGKIVSGGPVQIFSPGYRNTYDLVITKAGRMYVSDNGANGGWGGLPQNEGPAVNGQSLVTNNYHYILDGSGNVLEPGGDPGTSYNGQTVNNKDNLHLVTGKGSSTIANYVFGSYYGGHPTPIRANPTGAGLYTHDGGNSDFNGYFRTSYTGNSSTTLPYDWPPVPPSLADPRQGDFRNPGTNLGIGEDGALLTWSNNTNPLTEYTASNLSGAYKGNILAGHSNGYLHRVELNEDGSLKKLTQNFASPGGTVLGLTAQGDNEIFPGTIWIAGHGGEIKVMEPQDYDGGGGTVCLQPGQTGYDPLADYDNDGYSNQDEISNNVDHCASSIFPPDFDKDFISDLNDPDDDNDGIPDHLDPFQMGIPFNLPVKNELFSDKMPGFRGLGLTGLMTNLKSTDNYLNWMDKPGDGNGVDDIYGGAVGAITVYMTAGTAYGTTNTQAKAFQFGVNMDQSKGPVTVRSRMLAPYHAHSAGQTQGIFIGNGDQDNYLSVNLVTNGYEVVKEIAGVAQKTFYALARPSTSLDIYFLINPVNGTVQPKISINGATPVSLGTPITVSGALLAAIQQASTPMAVGLIGTNGGTSEFPVNIDFFYVEGAVPYITQSFENVNLFLGNPSYTINLADYFDDDNGDAQLAFSIQQNTVSGITPTIQGSTLTIPNGSQATSGTIKIRATDADGNFIEQNVSVTIAAEAVVLFRVNTGGAQIAALDQGKPNWTGDTSASPSGYVNTGSSVATFDGLTLHQSVNASVVPASLFTTERWDDAPAPEMLWTFPVQQPGTYEVRLYFRNGYSGTATAGSRVFSVKIEGQSIPSLTNIDLSGTYGHQVGVMLNAIVQSDENLQIEFIHGVENPLINGIEILRASSGGGNAPPVITAIPNQTNKEGDQPDLAVIATDTDNLIYSISGQPAGLSMEPTNGHITGIIASGAAANSPYTVTVTVSDQVNTPVSTTFTWTVTTSANGTGQWVSLHTGTCVVASNSAPGSCPQARHENGYVQIGDKFYLIGGRENNSNVNMYDPITKQWTVKANAPISMHHLQAVAYDGLIYVVGALTGGYPGEQPVPDVYIYNPLSNQWFKGPSIPRKRGAAAAVLHNGKIYVVSGQTSGHAGGQVNWVDEFNPLTNSWRQLANIPNSRDHFHVTIVNGKMYAIAGRKSDYLSPAGVAGNTVAPVDVFDFATETWSTLPSSANIPTQRAGASNAYLGNEIVVVGGESNNSSSLTKAEAFNPITQTWRTVANMITGRHATQAIVNNQVLYLAGGSPTTGGGLSYTNEAFYFNTLTTPQLTAISQSNLTGPSELDFGAVANGTTSSQTITITNSGSSQAIQISSFTVTGTGFQVSLPSGYTLPVLLKPGASLALSATYQSNGTSNASGQVAISNSGQNASLSIALKANSNTTTTYTLTTNASGSGSISKSPDKLSYTSGELVQLTATPLPGWQFSSWSGNASGSTNPLSVTMDANKAITANFTQLPGSGQQVISYTLINAQTDVDIMTITDGATVNLSQVGTSLNIRANTNPITVGSVKMSLTGATVANRTETAAPYALFGDSNGNYAAGTLNLGTHTLTTTPYTGGGGSGTAGTPLSINFIVANDTNPVSYTLTTTITGSGTVSNSPSKTTYTSGESVQLTATPSSGWLFDHWEGNITGNTNPATIVMNSNKSITAVFTQLPTGGQQVVSFTLINAQTDQDVITITNGATINIAQLAGIVNIRANTNPSLVGSVVMNLSGATTASRVETAAPYALYGDSNGNYGLGSINTGNHTLTATPYTSSGGNGTAGTPLSISFAVINDPTKGVSARVSADEDIQSVTNAEVTIYPNPFNDKIFIRTGAPTSTKMSVEILDGIGRIVETHQTTLHQSGGEMIIDASHFSNGLYIIRISNGDGKVKDYKVMKY